MSGSRKEEDVVGRTPSQVNVSVVTASVDAVLSERRHLVL